MRNIYIHQMKSGVKFENSCYSLSACFGLRVKRSCRDCIT